MYRVLKKKKTMSNRILYPENKCLKFIGEVIKQKQLNKICKNSLPVDLHNKKCKSPTGRKKAILC